jgi:hypothetical protein
VSFSFFFSSFRDVLAYVYIYVVQKELDKFKDVNWNETRGRKQKEKRLPQGIPNHLYAFPEEHDGRDCGTELSDDILLQVEEEVRVTEDDHDWMSADLRAACEQLLPDPANNVEPSELNSAYITLRDELYNLGFRDRIRLKK